MTNAAPTALSPSDARRVLAGGRALQALTADWAQGDGRLREEVRRTFDELREQMVRRDVANIPISRIKEATSGGLRIGALETARYSTVLSVLDAHPYTLQAIPGVGATTAYQAIAAARQIADAVRTNLQFRIDLDPSDPASTALISALYRWDTFGALAERLRQPTDQVSPDLRAAIEHASPTASLVRMMFRGAKRKAGARAALARIQQLLDWSDNSGYGAGLQRAKALIRADSVPAETAWKDFERRSVEYYGRLSEIVALGLDVAAAEGFLPADIIARVNKQVLDDTFRRVSLRGYQAFGARFAIVQRRAMIGDEMGLGKTIEAIAAMAHLRALDQQHFLVACPGSVVVNWTREIQARSMLRPYLIHGSEKTANRFAWIRNGGVAVTTIDSLHRLNVPDDIEIGMLVVDEAHYAKNPNARRSLSVRNWSRRVERVLFLTGTPMENSVDEFRNLIDYLQPGLTGRILPAHAAAGATAFRKNVASVYLRRNQEDVLQELPDLTRVDEWIEFGPHEQRAYRQAVTEGNFMAMRRAAYAVPHPTHSAKLTRLMELVDESAANGRKIVIFSFFRDVLDTVHRTVGTYAIGPLTGSTPVPQRQALIDRFTAVEGHAVLISQIQAGGVGLNMQTANVAILCEPQLKPTTEDQAIARLHRMGQVRAVQVHRLLAVNTADERLLDLLAVKRDLFNDYARRSDIAEASPEAIDISDVELSRQIVAMEQERLASELLGAPEMNSDPA